MRSLDPRLGNPTFIFWYLMVANLFLSCGAIRIVSKVVGVKAAPNVVTVGYIGLWYALNVAFNLQNKVIFNYFPYPWFVSSVHVVVGALYCAVLYAIGAKQASFGRVGLIYVMLV